MLAYVLAFAAAGALSFLLAYPIRRIALFLDIVDRPDSRKMHQIPIPLMGGAAIFLSFLAVSAVHFLVFDGLAQDYLKPYLALTTGALLIVLLGLYDDAKGLTAPVKFLGQIVAAIPVVSSGLTVDIFTNPLGDSFDIGWLGVPVSILWIVGVTNAVNLIDGLDGLAVGLGGIAAVGLFAVSVPGNPFTASMTIILAGACFGLLRHNFYPARMFLGDTGSMFIGFTLAVVGLHGSYKATTATALILPIMVLGVPIFDTLLAIVRRAKLRVSPFKADREHIHHRLVRIGLHHRSVVLVVYFVSIYLALTAYSIARMPYRQALLFLVLLTVGGIIGLRTVRFIEERFEAGMGRPAGAAGRQRSRRSPGAPGVTSRFSTLACEVGGLRDDFGGSADLQTIAEDVRAMLSRRIKIQAVVTEPWAPGRILLMVRTEPLAPPLTALVKDGLEWYLQEHRERLAGDSSFPDLHWIRAGGAVGPRPAPVTPSDEKERAIVLGDARARATGT